MQNKKNSANIIATQITATQTKQNYIAKSASHKNAKITAAQKKLHRNKTAAPKNCSTKTLQYKQTNNQTKLLHKKLATQTLQCKLQHKKLQCKKNWNAAGIVKLPPSGPQTSTTTRPQPALNHPNSSPRKPRKPGERNKNCNAKKTQGKQKQQCKKLLHKKTAMQAKLQDKKYNAKKLQGERNPKTAAQRSSNINHRPTPTCIKPSQPLFQKVQETRAT